MAFERRVGGNSSQTQKKSNSYFKKNYRKVSKIAEKEKSWESRFSFGRVFSWWFFGITIFLGLCFLIIYIKVLAGLPSIEELEKMQIAEGSTIYDREGGELYSIFDENRKYVTFDQISENMVNAIVAGEDKGYWENPGVDFIGLFRAFIYGIIGKNEGFWGTSTLTQQLIRNTIIENRSSSESFSDKIERKIKEIYLAFKLTNGVSKEKILELYLNKISFGSNAYGIEKAANTFFGKSADNLSVLEASILASLPKWPTYYSPYNNYDRLMGYPYIYKTGDEDNSIMLITPDTISANAELVQKLKDFIAGLKLQRLTKSTALLCGLSSEKVKKNISVDSDGCSEIDYSDLMVFLNAMQISSGDQVIEYQTGRKDYILGRMLEDDYIDFTQYREAILGSIGFEFQQYQEKIKYPHFVFYIREYLEEKFWKDLLEKGGLRIYTSLDPNLQETAESLVKAQAARNEVNFWAQNMALVSLDNETGEILAMVGGRDYFDEEHKGNINMTTAMLQPGSSFKPFVYSIAIDREQIGSKTPIFDVETTFPGSYTPKNFDGKFMGKMNVSSALNYSRNIPAVKMFYLAGGETVIEDWMDKLGATSVKWFKAEYLENNGREYMYGASMALGTAMMTPLEEAQAYSVYANLGKKRELVPVLKIVDAQWLVIEEHTPEQNKGEQVIEPATAYILNKILSDRTTTPSGWNKFYTDGSRPIAAKTGTSTKGSSGEGKTVYPRNLWTIGYTPQITTVVWAGNNDGSETYLNGNGLETAAPVMRDFMIKAHEGKPALDWKQPEGVKTVNISDISGKLAPDGMTANIVASMFINPPTEYGAGLQSVQVDLLCNGKITENTPESAIGYISVSEVHSLRPDDPAWETPVRRWAAANGYGGSSVSQEACERRFEGNGNMQVGARVSNGEVFYIGANKIEVAYQSDTQLSSLEVYFADQRVTQIDLGNRKEGVSEVSINVPANLSGTQTLTVKIIDNEFFSTSQSYSISIDGKDTTPPEISLKNPVDGTIVLESGQFFNLRGTVSDSGEIKSININLDGNPLKVGLKGNEFNESVSAEGMESWSVHTITIEAVDSNFNKSTQSVTLTIL